MKFHTLLTALFKLEPDDSQSIGNAEFARTLSSAALLTAVALKPFTERGNHWAVTTGWVMFSVYAIACAERQRKGVELVTPSLNIAGEAIDDNLTSLLREACERDGKYWEGIGIADFAAYDWRYTLLMGIRSLYWLECECTGRWTAPELKEPIESMLRAAQRKMKLWGEAAIPQFAFHEWYLERVGSEFWKHLIVELATTILNKPLFWAYYSAEDVIRHEFYLTFEAFTSEIPQDMEGETMSSHFSEVMMIHLAQRNLKEACLALWPRYSQVSSLAFLPKESWMYCLAHCEEGDNHVYIPPETGQWANLVAESQRDIQDTLPLFLAGRPLLLALWSMIVPYRATTPVICHLYKAFTMSQVDAAARL